MRALLIAWEWTTAVIAVGYLLLLLTFIMQTDCTEKPHACAAAIAEAEAHR